MTAFTLADRAKALREVEIFGDVGPRDLELLAAMAETEVFAAGETLWEVGEAADRVHVVVRGALSVWLPGRERPVTTLPPGEIVGELAMFAQARRTAAVRADEPTTVLSFRTEAFREFLLGHPEATFALLGRIVRRFLLREREAAPP
jgi:CRP-like cAMP-binding protein